MRFVVAGSVSTTRVAIETLLTCGAELVGVLGLDPTAAENVSGYVDLRPMAAKSRVPFQGFSSINSPDVIATLKAWTPDVVLVIGLSQLVRDEFLAVPSRCCVGFHPTQLPRGRGRAPIAWLILDGGPGAATLFVMDEGADTGRILEQVPFAVEAGDYAADVLTKTEQSLKQALVKLLPRLIAGDMSGQDQDESLATIYGKRTVTDGRIDWERSADEICRLVRAASAPHPGAYTYLAGERLVVWRATVEHDVQGRGVVGRILSVTSQGDLIVQAGSGLVRVQGFELPRAAQRRPIVGAMLGVDAQEMVLALEQKVASLEKLVDQLIRK